MAHWPRRVLVTGAAGFVGRHMLRLLETAADRPSAIIALDRAIPREEAEAAEWVACDLLDGARLRAVLASHAPDAIVHLAAAVTNDPAACFAGNVHAAEILFGEASRMPVPPRIVIVGSAAEYGATRSGEAVPEDHSLNAETAYGVSKVLQERWALLYHAARGLPVICTRPFNMLGPGQSAALVPATFMAQIQDVIAGRSSVVKVGNTTSSRDFVDVRDVVAAFWALLGRGPEAVGQVYNIASGEPTRIQDVLDACLKLSGGGVPVETSMDRMKSSDVSIVVGDARKLRTQTGWRITIPWRDSLADMWTHLGRQPSRPPT